MKYSTTAKHSSFAVVIRTSPVPVYLKSSFYKLFPFLLKDFLRVFWPYQVTWRILYKFDKSQIITLWDVFASKSLCCYEQSLGR